MPPSINTQVTVTADNRWIDVWDAALGVSAFGLPVGTYDDMPAVCAALQVGLQALGGPWAAATVGVVFDLDIPGKIRINTNQAVNLCSILWSTGVHGRLNAHNHCGDLLGYDDAADDVNAYSFNSDYQHQHGWYSVRAISKWGPVAVHHVGGEIRRTLSRSYCKSVTIGHGYDYDFVLEALEPWHVYEWDAVGANLNRALLTGNVWGQMHSGEQFRVRQEAATFGTYLDVYLISPRDTYGALTRKYPDYECYDIALRLQVKE